MQVTSLLRKVYERCSGLRDLEIKQSRAFLSSLVSLGRRQAPARWMRARWRTSASDKGIKSSDSAILYKWHGSDFTLHTGAPIRSLRPLP